MRGLRSLPSATVARVAGLVVPIVVAIACIPLRASAAPSTVALILVAVVVVIASAGDRLAAVLAALSAVLGYDTFHTVPYNSLRITSSEDIQTAVLLLVIGLVVGEVAARGRHHRHLSSVTAGERDRLESVSGLVADGEPSGIVLLTVAAALVEFLQLNDCRYESGVREEPFPTIEPTGEVRWGPLEWDTTTLGLPDRGADLPVRVNGRVVGRFVCTPRPGTLIDRPSLLRAVALANQSGAALVAGGRAA
jgi:hypothetical protein